MRNKRRTMDRTDCLIRGGLVYDGSGAEPYIADIAVKGDRITAVGRELPVAADRVIEASGLAVSPGFIDTHAHSDFTLMADPRASGKLSQGITTEINGNCGMSAAPLFGKAAERREQDLLELGIRERWNTLAEYLSLLESRRPSINFATLAGHGNIRGSIVGYDERTPTQAELSLMAGLLKDAVEQGAIGLSTGLIYPPGIYSETEELVSLGWVLRDRDLIYTSHMRSEGDRINDAVAEVLRIGQEAGIKVHISHIKTAGQQNWSKADRIIALLEDTIRAGMRLTCDRYPYIASSTDLDSILPAWTYAGGNEDEIRRLLNDDDRKRIARETAEQWAYPGYWEKVIISTVSSEKNRWMEGKTIAEISRRLGVVEAAFLLDILVEEKLRVGAIFLSMSEENLRKFLALPFCMIGSDSSARCPEGPTKQGMPHPRGFGTFPRFLGKYVRDEGLMTLSVAIHKATQLAADTFGLKGRGVLREGAYADITVFDAAGIKDRAAFEQPYLLSEGIHFVLVNGTPAVWEGRITGSRGGRILRG